VASHRSVAGAAAQDFDVRPLLHDGGATVIVTGALARPASARLIAAVQDILRCRPPQLTVDLRGVTSMDMAGVAPLATVDRCASDVGCALRLVCAEAAALALLDRLGVPRRVVVTVDADPDPSAPSGVTAHLPPAA